MTPLFTDLIDGETVRAFQEGIASITNVATVICDHLGRPVIGPSGPVEALSLLAGSAIGSQRLASIRQNLTAHPGSSSHPFLDFAAAHVLHGQRCIGSIIIGPLPVDRKHEPQSGLVADEFGLTAAQAEDLAALMNVAHQVERSTAVNLVDLIAKIISQLVAQAAHLRHRELELGTVYSLTDLLAGTQDLQVV